MDAFSYQNHKGGFEDMHRGGWMKAGYSLVSTVSLAMHLGHTYQWYYAVRGLCYLTKQGARYF